MSAPIRSGTAMVLGAALLVAVASVGRWRRWPRPATADAMSDAAVAETSPLLPDYSPLGRTGSGLPDRDTQPDLGGRAGRGGGVLERSGADDQTTPGGSGSSWVTSLRGGEEGGGGW
jgi:hypothetical protein